MTKFSSEYQPERRGDQSEAGKASGKSRLLTSALNVALKREEEDDEGNKITTAHAIVNTMVKKAKEGDVVAAKECWDRSEGKPSQAVDLEVTGNIGVFLWGTKPPTE